MNSRYPFAADRMVQPAVTASTASANAALIDELIDRLEAEEPNPLLARLATGFPSALLCVLALGALAGALAGRQVSGAEPRLALAAQAAPVVQTARQAPPLPELVTQDPGIAAQPGARPAPKGLLYGLHAARHAQLAQAEQLAMMGTPLEP